MDVRQAPARLTYAAVNPELILVRATQAGATDVIANARTAFVDAAAQHGRDGAAQAIGITAGHIFAEQGGRQPGFEQRFVGIDVADAGHAPLVEQDRLEAAARFGQAHAPVGWIHIKGFRAQAAFFKMSVQVLTGFKEVDAAEATYVTKAKLPVTRV